MTVCSVASPRKGNSVVWRYDTGIGGKQRFLKFL